MFVRLTPSLIGILLSCCILAATPTQAARILGFFSTPSKSHSIIHTSVVDALAHAGHDVTVISVIKNIYPNARYKYIHIDLNKYGVYKESTLSNLVNESKPFYLSIVNLVRGILETSNNTLNHPTVREFLRSHGKGDFDLVIVGHAINDFLFGLSAHFNCPVVVSFMVEPLHLVHRLVGNPVENFQTSPLFTPLQRITFWGRVANYLSNLYEQYIIDPVLDLDNLEYYNYNFPPDRYPPLDEVRKNVSLVFVNHHFSQGPIRPNVPNLIEIGGIQIKEKPDPLPTDIAKILDESKEGVIYFSLGSNIQGSHLTPEKTKIMFDVISKLPYKVLWKWGAQDQPGQSKNIIFKEWLPQDDILAHPNIKLFITHGGMGSVVESQYHGVPMVGIPLFGDQPSNMANVERSGYGLYVDYAKLSEESLDAAIQEVLHNPKYTNKVREFSRLYRDRPMTARQTVVYWTEYVLRHNGAKHMQSPAVHMNQWQLMSLDVIGFLLACIAVFLYAIVLTFRLLRYLLRKVTKTKKD